MKETKGFLLKAYLENHKLRVDSNTSACLSIYVVIEAIEKENTRDQRKLKIATSAISMYTTRLMCLKIKSQNTTKSVVSHKEGLQTIYQH